jgi:hypothetical protein
MQSPSGVLPLPITEEGFPVLLAQDDLPAENTIKSIGNTPFVTREAFPDVWGHPNCTFGSTP